jgi:hypothetical protein
VKVTDNDPESPTYGQQIDNPVPAILFLKRKLRRMCKAWHRDFEAVKAQKTVDTDAVWTTDTAGSSENDDV